MNHPMSFLRASLRTSFLSIPLLAGAVLATGCMDAEPTTGTGESAILSGVGPSPVAPISEVRVVGDRVSLASPGWTQTAPGIWTASSKAGEGSIVIGAEGHRAAIARTEAALAALRANGGSTEAIERQEAYLGNLKDATQRIAIQPPVTQAVSCNIGFVIARSSLIFPGFIGMFAGAQLSCTGGTQVFTVQAQVCTDFGCGAVSTFTPTIGATPLLFGTGQSGTLGAFCFGQAFVSPPGLLASGNAACG
jgi:hypothetical protein